jgi:hypothetical protein
MADLAGIKIAIDTKDIIRTFPINPPQILTISEKIGIYGVRHLCCSSMATMHLRSSRERRYQSK